MALSLFIKENLKGFDNLAPGIENEPPAKSNECNSKLALSLELEEKVSV